MTEQISLDLIRADADLQMRDGGVDVGTVAEYAEAMADGAIFPAVTVYFDGSVYWLADGFHRVEAARKANLTEIAADVRQGGRRDAMLAAVGVNASHGLRRTNADKRRAVMALLRDPDWTRWSNSKIAKQCLVDDKTVAKIRNDLTRKSEVTGHQSSASTSQSTAPWPR
ncbi:MAG: ParB/RepB/Spo0J family partition protein [Xanthobacteraceae bacterium]|nr:ParB/RepB/Spo0J family partition protein [Xanthobacteraceae bacterium]